MTNYVYRFLDTENQIVYVGKTNQTLASRMRQHFSGSGHLKKERLAKVTKIEFVTFATKVEMNIAELYLINLWKPEFNTKDKYDEKVTFQPFDVNELDWSEFLLSNITKNRIDEQDESTFSIADVIEENSLLTEMLNDYYDGKMFEYRECYSEHDYVESVLQTGFFFKPNELNAERVNWLFTLLEKHQQGKTSKEHTIYGEKTLYTFKLLS